MLRIAAVLMLFLAGFVLLVDANAMKTAQVTNSSTIDVVNTNTAKLAVSPIAGSYPDTMNWSENPAGQLVLDLTQSSTGFEVGSTYTIRDLFQITNLDSTAKVINVTPAYNTKATITFECSIPGMGVPWSTMGTCPALIPNQTMLVSVVISPFASGSDLTMEFKVSGQ